MLKRFALLLAFWGFGVASLWAEEPLAIVGRIHDRGEPVAGARVELWDRQEASAPLAAVASAHSGRFRLQIDRPAFWQLAIRVGERSFLYDIEPASRPFQLPALDLDAPAFGWRIGETTFCQRPLAAGPSLIVEQEKGKLAAPPALLFWHDVPCSESLTDHQGQALLPKPQSASVLKVVATGHHVVRRQADRLVLAPAPQTIRGQVVDSSGRPIENAEVAVRLSAPDSDARTYSDQEGGFVLSALPPAEPLAVQIRHPDFEGLDLRWPAGRIVMYRLPVLRGRLVDGSGRPVPEASLRLSKGKVTAAATRSGPEGTFLFEALPSAQWLGLAAQAEGFAPASRRIPAFAGALELAEWRLFEAFRLRRQVLGGDGQPLAAVEVFEVDPEERKRALELPPAGKPVARTDDAGFFELPAVAAEKPIGLELRAAGHQPRLITATVPAALPDPLELAKALRVAGRIFSDDGPIQGAIVYLDPAGDDFIGSETRSAADGSFALEPANAGRRRLRIESPLTLSFEQWLEIPAEGLSDLEIELAKGYSVHGRVLGPEGKPAASVLLHWKKATDERGSWLFSSKADGSFSLRNLLPGPGRLTLFRSDLGRIDHEMVLSGDVEGLELRMEKQPRSNLTVELTAENGQPVENAVLSLMPAEDGIGVSLAGRSNGEGIALLNDLPPGRYLLRVEQPEYVDLQVEVLLPREKGLTLGLQKACTIAGKVDGLSPEELARLRVSAKQNTDFRGSTLDPLQGRFELNGLRPGEWEILFELPPLGPKTIRSRCDQPGSTTELVVDWDALP